MKKNTKKKFTFDENVPVPVLKAAEVVYEGLPVPEYYTLLRYIKDGINGHFLPAVNWRKPGGKRDQWRISVRAFREFLKTVEKTAPPPYVYNPDLKKRAEAAMKRIRAMC